MGTTLEKMEPEAVNTSTQKYAKYVYQLEKGLPQNAIVPELKLKVEAMKERLGALTDLRNPTLRARHWEKLEELLGVKLNSVKEPVTLARLVELGAFTPANAERVQEISA